MKRPLILCALAALLFLSAGCTTQKSAHKDQRTAYSSGRQAARLELQENRKGEDPESIVSFSGAVKNASIPWREELSLRQAIVEARHSARRNPRAVFVRRGADVFQVPVWRLLHGDDFMLEPGDHIEIRQ